MNLPFLGISCKWNHTIAVLLCFISLNITFSSPVHIVAYIKISFLFMAEYYYIVYIYHILFIHLPVGGYLDGFHLLAFNWIMLLLTLVYKYLYESLISVLLDIYLRVKLLGQMVLIGLTFWETAKLFSIAAVLLYIHSHQQYILHHP